jgi:bifunctional oligoribonuclease and PAP phosphatase NrnA
MSKSNGEIKTKILDALRDGDGFVIFNHANPDGDAIGSQIALGIALKKTGKKVYMFSAENIGAEYGFLPYTNEIHTTLPDSGEYTTAVILDAAKPDRISKNNRVDLSRFSVVINIDHHVSNTEYGTINWIVPESSSAGELVYELIKAGKYPIDPEIANCLYTSIFTDTGGFRHSNTTAKALRFCAELVDAGAQPHIIARHIFSSYPERRFRMLGKALGTLKTVLDGKAAYMWVYADFYKETGSIFEDADEFVEYPRALSGVEVAYVIKETKANEAARVNFRSNSLKRNVNRVAARFGGGGHIEAAACNIEGTREEMEKRIYDAVRDEFSTNDIA